MRAAVLRVVLGLGETTSSQIEETAEAEDCGDCGGGGCMVDLPSLKIGAGSASPNAVATFAGTLSRKHRKDLWDRVGHKNVQEW